MSAGGLQILDGSKISDALPTFDDHRLLRLFQQLAPDDHDGCVIAAKCRAAALSETTDLLSGIRIPDNRFDHALQASQFPLDDSFRLDQAAFASKLRDLLQCIANALHEEPLVVSISDGAVIKSLLEDEDDFAMLAENLFTEFDVDDKGKISSQKLRTALLQMGFEMGVPVPSAKPEAEDLVSSILTKYGCDGDEEIGQAQFAKLLQGILEDLSASLASHPLVITLNVRVNNGHKLRKLLDNVEQLSKVADGMFEKFDLNRNGKLERDEVRHFLESRGMEWGLPPKESSELVGQVYDEVFSISDTDHSGEIDKEEFRALLQQIFESFAVQLEFSPIFVAEEMCAP